MELSEILKEDVNSVSSCESKCYHCGSTALGSPLEICSNFHFLCHCCKIAFPRCPICNTKVLSQRDFTSQFLNGSITSSSGKAKQEAQHRESFLLGAWEAFTISVSSFGKDFKVLSRVMKRVGKPFARLISSWKEGAVIPTGIGLLLGVLIVQIMLNRKRVANH